MGANLSQEIIDSLKVLGLRPGASTADVRTAFRHLAHTCHPDIVGSAGVRRFQQITGAYALLKGLTPGELESLAQVREEHQPTRHKTLFDWYRKRRESELNEPVEDSQQEAEEALRQARKRSRRVDTILEQYSQKISRHLEQMERSEDQNMIDALLSRLKSESPAVRRLALGRVGPLANREDVRQALTSLLLQREVDEGTARLLCSLPLEPGTRRRLAGEVAGHAASFPNSLLTLLLDLRQQEGSLNLPLLDRYLASASPAGIALLLRHWPVRHPPTDATLRQLLKSDDPQVLVPVLSAMKQHFPGTAPHHKKRLTELQQHPTPAVRVWGRALLG